MVTNFEIFSLMQEVGMLNILVKKGILSLSYLDHMKIYQSYLGHRKDKKKMQSYECAAIDCQVSLNTVRLVVKSMES